MSQRFHVLITDRFDVQALALLKSDARVSVKISDTPLPTDEELSDCEILIIRSHTRIDNSLLARAPKLKAIITATSGFDHIDLHVTSGKKLFVMHTPEANATSASELTWALALACSRKIIEAHRAVKNADWRRDLLLGTEFFGKTYGIVGLGRIGKRVAKIAEAFGMRVVAFDPYLDQMDFENANVTRTSLDELMKLSDVVSFHVPATKETDRMLNVNLLESMNRHAILINTSRGSIVSERDLVQALSEKWIAACGLDVFEREPLPRDSRLMGFSNLVLSPHLGATTSEAFARASFEAAQKVLKFVASGETSDRLPPETAWYHSEFSGPS